MTARSTPTSCCSGSSATSRASRPRRPERLLARALDAGRRSEQGTRALDQLRDGVEEAIAALGRGFLAHPANAALREALRGGAARHAGLLPPAPAPRLPAALPVRRRGPRACCSTRAPTAARPRALRATTTRPPGCAGWPSGAAAPATPTSTQALRLVMASSASDAGCPELACPALGSFLWSRRRRSPTLAAAELANHDLLDAVRALAFDRATATSAAPVDYRNLGAEELAASTSRCSSCTRRSTPRPATFALDDRRRQRAQDHRQLLHADEPDHVPARLRPRPGARRGRRAAQTPRRRSCDLKVCDPACGSGHFLIAAAHRIAKRLAARAHRRRRAVARGVPHARCATSSAAASTAWTSTRWRSSCARSSLWLEALEPGQAALVPRPPHLSAATACSARPRHCSPTGIPDEAFEPIEGDDKDVVHASCRKQNRERARGPADDVRPRSTRRPGATSATSRAAWPRLDAIADDTDRRTSAPRSERYAELVALSRLRVPAALCSPTPGARRS